MAIAIEELRINDIVLAPNAISKRRCIVKAIHDGSVSVNYLNMQTNTMDYAELKSSDLEPVILMESTLYALGFRKTENVYYGSPANKCYILKRNGYKDVVAIYTNQWHLFIPNVNGSFFDKRELYLHTLQNYLSNSNECAEEVSYELFVELTNPYCVSPFKPI